MVSLVWELVQEASPTNPVRPGCRGVIPGRLVAWGRSATRFWPLTKADVGEVVHRVEAEAEAANGGRLL